MNTAWSVDRSRTARRTCPGCLETSITASQCCVATGAKASSSSRSALTKVTPSGGALVPRVRHVTSTPRAKASTAIARPRNLVHPAEAASCVQACTRDRIRRQRAGLYRHGIRVLACQSSRNAGRGCFRATDRRKPGCWAGETQPPRMGLRPRLRHRRRRTVWARRCQMIVVCAPDSYKESMTAPEAAQAMADGVRDAVPDAVVIQLPMSDGGEGFVAAIAAATGDTWVPVVVPDALGRPIEAGYAWSPATHRAVIEMASAAGLEPVAPSERNVRRSSTMGVGRLVLAALDAGARHLVVGLGGSATNDGGAGLLVELGVVFRDPDGAELT